MEEQVEELVKVKPGLNLFDYSWTELATLSEDATINPEKYEYMLGQCKAMDVGEYGIMYFQLIGINHDTLADGSGKAGFTFFAKTADHNLTITPCSNGTSTNESGNGAIANDTSSASKILSAMPPEVQSAIKSVKKSYYSCYFKSYTNTLYLRFGKQILSKKLWTISEKELTGSNKGYYSNASSGYYQNVEEEDCSQYQYFIGNTNLYPLYRLESSYGVCKSVKFATRTPNTRFGVLFNNNSFSISESASDFKFVPCFCI